MSPKVETIKGNSDIDMPNTNILNIHMPKSITLERQISHWGKFYNKKTKMKDTYTKRLYKLIRKRQNTSIQRQLIKEEIQREQSKHI